MKFAILGGTHGNEPTGIKVVEHLARTEKCYHNSFKAFFANPVAYEKRTRYVDSDLNRAFGAGNKNAKGYEKLRAKELSNEISGHYDTLLDLHTTTSNMGTTVILTHLDEVSLKSACYLKKQNPELTIIVSVRAGKQCPYTTHMTQSGLTIEIGPIANNVVKSELVLKTYKLIEDLLNFDFKEDFDYSTIDCFKTIGIMDYPSENLMLHPLVDGHDFQALENGSPLFIDIQSNVINYEGKTIYPLFINEAAYQENNTAMEYAIRGKLSEFITPAVINI